MYESVKVESRSWRIAVAGLYLPELSSDPDHGLVLCRPLCQVERPCACELHRYYHRVDLLYHVPGLALLEHGVHLSLDFAQVILQVLEHIPDGVKAERV